MKQTYIDTEQGEILFNEVIKTRRTTQYPSGLWRVELITRDGRMYTTDETELHAAKWLACQTIPDVTNRYRLVDVGVMWGEDGPDELITNQYSIIGWKKFGTTPYPLIVATHPEDRPWQLAERGALLDLETGIITPFMDSDNKVNSLEAYQDEKMSAWQTGHPDRKIVKQPISLN